MLPFSLASIICKFGCSNHTFSIEQGRVIGIDSFPCVCALCDSNQLGDISMHIFSIYRHKYLPTYCQKRVNTDKCTHLMYSAYRNALMKLPVYKEYNIQIVMMCSAFHRILEELKIIQQILIVLMIVYYTCVFHFSVLPIVLLYLLHYMF